MQSKQTRRHDLSYCAPYRGKDTQLFGEFNQLDNGVQGDLGPCQRLNCCKETGGRYGNAYMDILLVSYRGMAVATRRAGHGNKGKSPTIKGMCGVNDFNLIEIAFVWVVERGVKLGYRLTTSIMNS